MGQNIAVFSIKPGEKPLEIGSNLATQMVLPIIKEIVPKMDHKETAQLYCGIIMALVGMMFIDIGKTDTQVLLQAGINAAEDLSKPKAAG